MEIAKIAAKAVADSIKKIYAQRGDISITSGLIDEDRVFDNYGTKREVSELNEIPEAVEPIMSSLVRDVVILEPNTDERTINIDGKDRKVVAIIEPKVDIMAPGWTIAVLESAFHLHNHGNPSDENYPLVEHIIPFADPKAIEKTAELAANMAFLDSSAQIGVICMEVDDNDPEDQSKWVFTIERGETVITNPDGTQTLAPSPLFPPGKVILPSVKK